MSLIQLKQKDLKEIRERWWEENNQCCPILKQKFPIEDMVVDHQHKLKAQIPDETGHGIVRGVIEFRTNGVEGKITNAFKRYGLDKLIDLPSFLRNLADYLECNRQHDEVKYIHPREEPKPPKLMKSSYNKLVKLIQKDGKRVPKYSVRLTKQLETLYSKYNLVPEFH